MNVLFVGNSFTFYYDVPALFGSLCTADGRDVKVESVTKGGWTLEKHASPDDECGKLVEEKLTSETKYDIVILQEFSNRPIENFGSFLSGCKALAAKVRKNNKTARILLYETWSYGDEHPYLQEKGIKAEEMQKELENAYAKAAKEINAEVSHVGKGMLDLYRTTDTDPYGDDRKHQSYAGSYLAALTHFFKVFPDAGAENVKFSGECRDADREKIIKIALQSR